MPLHPQSRYLLDQVHRPRVTPYHLLDVAAMRLDARKLQFAFRPEPPPVAAVVEVDMPRPDASVLVARHYRPLGTQPDEVLPLLVYFHGGGFCVGDLDAYDVLCRELANFARCAVVNVAYRLAPEHAFPAAADDAAFALRWLHRHAAVLKLDPARFAVGGDSAGGNLATVTAIAAGESGSVSLCAQLLVYPMTDQRCTAPSHVTFGEGYLLTREVIRRFQEFYLPDPALRLDWRASPLFAPSLDRLPPTLVIAAECDPLVDDGRAYVKRLAAAGVAVECHEFAGMIHGFFTLGKLFDDGAAAVKLAARWLAAKFENAVRA